MTLSSRRVCSYLSTSNTRKSPTDEFHAKMYVVRTSSSLRLFYPFAHGKHQTSLTLGRIVDLLVSDARVDGGVVLERAAFVFTKSRRRRRRKMNRQESRRNDTRRYRTTCFQLCFAELVVAPTLGTSTLRNTYYVFSERVLYRQLYRCSGGRRKC